MIEWYMKSLCISYYAGEPQVSDEEYDALERMYGQVLHDTGDVLHMYRMYSLEKHYDRDGVFPINSIICTETDKLDGAAVSILYLDGKRFHMLKRGNGILGTSTLPGVCDELNIPEYIECSGIVQITGEVVASKDVENSRNYASGALGLKDLEEFKERKTNGNMAFIAYSIQHKTNGFGLRSDYEKDMSWLNQQGFQVVTMPNIHYIDGWGDLYPLDGTVYRISDNEAFNRAGFTDKFPKGAFAHKEEEESVTTTLREVRWETGKSGKVAPTAYFDTVVIDGKNVNKATLNNIAYINALNLEIDCNIEVVLAGKIIPKITGRV